MAKGCTAARQKHRNVLPPPRPVCSFENCYGVGWCRAGTGWLEGTSGFTVMATASYIWGILTLAFVQLLWRGYECHHKQFQWLPLSPACVRRDKGSSRFFLLDVCPFPLNFFSFFPLIHHKSSAVSQQATSFAALAQECSWNQCSEQSRLAMLHSIIAGRRTFCVCTSASAKRQ